MSRLLICLLFACSVALAADKPVKVELTNPGFDNELKGWDNADKPELTGVFTLDGGIKRTGKAALHVTPQMPDQWPWISQQVAQVEPGAMYLLRAWTRGGTQPGKPATAIVRIEFIDANGRPTQARMARRTVPLQQWEQLGVQAQAPPQAASAVIYLRVTGSGEAWFDDVELLRLQAAPTLALSPQHMAVAPEKPGTMRLEVSAPADMPENQKIDLQLLGSDGKPVKDVAGELERRDQRTFAGEFALPALGSGRYVWQAKLVKDVALANLYVPLAERQPKSLSDRGILLDANNQPVFPIGIYHATIADYRAVAEQGFNMVQGPGTHEARVLRAAVQAAQEHKLWLDIPLHVRGMVGANFGASQEKMNYFRESPVVVGWKLADQPDQHPEIAEEIPETYARLKQKEPRRPLMLTVEDPETYAYWANFCDGLQVVGFPLPDQPLSLVAERTRRAKACLQPWQHLSALLPAGYRSGAAVEPTYAQARMMAYLAIIGGARGIWWYALRDTGWNLMEADLWKHFRDLNKEVAAVGAAALRAEISLQSDNPKLYVAAWEAGEKAVQVAVANPGTEPLTALLKTDMAPATAEVGQGKAAVEIKDGALQVTVEPGEAALVKVSAGDSDAA